MARSLLLLLAGVTTGAAAVYLLGSAPPREAASGAPALPEPVASPSSAPGAPDGSASGGYAAERLAIYEQAAAAGGAVEIESLVDLALDEFPSRLRDLKLSALLARLAEIDPAHAVAFARARYLEPELVVPLFEIWAATDADAAIAELALIAPPARQREIALAILGVIGTDAGGIERVAAALPAVDRPGFEAEALLARAEADPVGALRELLSAPNDYRRAILLPRIAEFAARGDPRAVLAQTASIEDYALRRGFRDAVLTAWAGLDPEAVYAWIEMAEIRDLPESTTVYQALAGDDPERLFALLDGLPPAIRTNAQRAAMQTLAETDPIMALARLETMPQGQDRDRLLQTIAQAYGRTNPDLALAWVRSLPPGQVLANMRNVLQGIMAVDPERAIDIVIAEIEGAASNPTALSSGVGSSLALLMSMSAITGGGATDFGRVADRLLAINQPVVRSALSSTIGNWARQSPDEALRWALNNVDRLDASTFEQMAQGLAQTDPERALRQIDQLPLAQRPAWVTGLAQRLAQSDPARARELLGRFRGQPEFASAYAAAAQAMARTDPPGAAALLSEAPQMGNSPQSRTGYMAVAREWSRSDPAAAADWALTIGDAATQRQALTQVAQGWAERDPAGAERWVREMSAGAPRDSALDGLVAMTAQAGRFDPRLLDAYSSAQAAQTGAANAIRTIGRTNLPEAQRLLDAHITDPRMRQQIEDYLARSGGTGSNSGILTSGGIIF